MDFEPIPAEILSDHESHKYLKKFKQSWERRFKPTRMKEVYESVDLGNYLAALNRIDEAIKVLNYVTIQIEFNGNYNIWSPTGAGIILLSRLNRIIGDQEGAQSAINRIIKNDYRAGDKQNFYNSTTAEHSSILKKVKSETQKWGCHILSRHLMGLNYLSESKINMLKWSKNYKLEELETLITESYILLAKKLNKEL